MGEFEFIQQIKDTFPSKQQEGIFGIGDDCAIFDCGNGKEWLISTDMLIEGVHFLMNEITPYQLGWKSAAVNISDIAAMGGQPRWVFLSLALPSSCDAAWREEFLRGFRDILSRYQVQLMGGDTCSSRNSLCVNVTIVGEAEKGRSLKRSAAQVGDWVVVTGNLGDSAAGLKLILEKASDSSENAEYLIQRHYLPSPRVEEGLALARLDGIGAMMDISDGIASDLEHILKASSVGARIDAQKLPRSAAFTTICQQEKWNEYELAACGGEDYELLFTCRPGTPLPDYCTIIGEITAQKMQLEWLNLPSSTNAFQGYRHF